MESQGVEQTNRHTKWMNGNACVYIMDGPINRQGMYGQLDGFIDMQMDDEWMDR